MKKLSLLTLAVVAVVAGASGAAASGDDAFSQSLGGALSQSLQGAKAIAQAPAPDSTPEAGKNPVIWQDRGDIASLDLMAGSGKGREPGSALKFLKESKTGASAKFTVEDENGAKWGVKLGDEVKSETAATRLIWAVGYFVDDDFYRAQIQVQGLPRLSRGRQFVSGDTVRDARLERKRHGGDAPDWSWYENAFTGTRELNGLKVMMSLINNWDLKQDNNGSANGQYEVADVGASFGRAGGLSTFSKGDLKDYAKTKFIEKTTPTDVDFAVSGPPLVALLNFPYYCDRIKMESMMKHIPIADARWIGGLLGQLSAEQIRDAFRTAGFSPAEVDGYAQVVTRRIAELKKL